MGFNSGLRELKYPVLQDEEEKEMEGQAAS
jgi:hypothetical protein